MFEIHGHAKIILAGSQCSRRYGGSISLQKVMRTPISQDVLPQSN